MLCESKKVVPTIGHKPKIRPRVADLESIAGSVSCFMYSMNGRATCKSSCFAIPLTNATLNEP